MSPQTVQLPRPGVPADRGLAALGLLMQLAGRITGALTVLLGIAVWFGPGIRHPAASLVVAALCLVRAQLHRRAGRDLAYGGRGAHPSRALGTYLWFGLAHAFVVGFLAAPAAGAGVATATAIFGALAVWPLALLAIFGFGGFGALDGYDQIGVPLGEDRGLEGASILMTVLGACGVLSTGAILLVLGGLPSRHLEHGWGPLVVVVFVLLLVRSALHVRAGLAGLREGSFDRPAELVARYVGFGAVSAFCVGGVLFLLAISEGAPPAGIIGVAVTCWLLASWPAIVKRFFHHRQFAELLDGDRVVHRRAPDAGLSALGWLLAGHAALIVSLSILAAAVGHDGPGHVIARLLTLAGPAIGHTRGALAASAVVIGLEVACAVALIQMRDRRREVATIYALVAGAVALALAWPMARPLGHAPFDLGLIARLAPTAIQLAIPAATLVLVHRAIAPAALARYRRRAA